MKKLVGMIVSAAVLSLIASAGAGEMKMSCCSGEKAGSCAQMSSKLNLTPDQQTRITLLNARLTTATSRSERKTMFDQGMKQILTADQYTQWKSAADKMAKTGTCPYMESECNGDKSS